MNGTELVEKTDSLPATQVEQQGLNPLVAAVLGGADVDLEKMEKMMAMQERFEANEAKKAYNAAMSRFRSEAPVIGKDSHVNYSTQKGTTDYRHSTLGAALRVINPLLAKYGLNPSWSTEQESGLITVTCTITHALGHSESTSLMASPDASGGKNNIQAIGSTVSYLERYTLFSICGLASSDQDNDAVMPQQLIDRITEDQVLTIEALIDDNKVNKSRFMGWLTKSLKAESIEDIAVTSYDNVIKQINRSIQNANSK